MLFEVVNSNGKTEMRTKEMDCLPSPQELKSLNSVGYRFRYDGAFISMKKAKEIAKGVTM